MACTRPVLPQSLLPPKSESHCGIYAYFRTYPFQLYPQNNPWLALRFHWVHCSIELGLLIIPVNWQTSSFSLFPEIRLSLELVSYRTPLPKFGCFSFPSIVPRYMVMDAFGEGCKEGLQYASEC